MPSHHMVQYQTWTQIGFEVARRKGFQTTGPGNQRTLAGGRGFDGTEPQAKLIELLAEVWQDRKEELSDADRPAARQIAESEITVS